MDKCEEKKLMDKIMRDPNNEFIGKERVCDKDVEKELWKLNGESKMEDEEKVIFDGKEKPIADDLEKEESLPGIEDVSAHSMGL